MGGKCFVIGPMTGHNGKVLTWLAHDVVQKLLPDWTVTTPESSQLGNIMNHVVGSCDAADLVIANTTGNTPNVLYEIGLLDALGRPCIPLKVMAPGETDAEADKMAFDRAAYRFYRIHEAPDRRAETDRTLKGAIDSALDIKARGGTFGNPITDYYGLPLCALSSGLGLARGYFINLVAPALADLGRTVPERSAYRQEDFADWKLEVAIPHDLDQATRDYVDGLVRKGVIRSVTLKAPGRNIFLYEYVDQHPACFRWMDIPTTLGSARDIVLARMGPNAGKDPASDDFKTIQADEIGQFVNALKGRINTDPALGVARNKVEVTWWQG